MKSSSLRKFFIAIILFSLALGLSPQNAKSKAVVDLAEFTATYSSGQILIEWETATEIDIAGFILTRSANPFPPFIDISGFIPAEGSGVIGAAYECIDNDVVDNTTYYYRLEIIDTNNYSEFSEVISVFAGNNNQIHLPLIQNRDPELTIEPGVNLSTPRRSHTSTRLLDGKMLIVGGSQAPDQHLASVEIFDPETGTINLVASLHTARHDHTATLLSDGRVLVNGGYGLPYGWISDAEIYDPSMDTWTVIPPNYSHGVNHTATLLNDGRVLVVGGCIGGGLCSNHVEIFDPITNTWTEVSPLTNDRSAHAAVLLENGNVLIAGGGSVIDTSQDSQALVYNPVSNEWNQAGLLNQPRLFTQAVLLSDGRVLITGGGYRNVPQIFEIFASTEIYDPILNTWLPTVNLQEARYFFQMPMLSDGRVLVVGGVRDPENSWTDQSFVSEIEIYDPVTDQWHLAGNLADPTAHGTASLLLDGRVWVTGGYSSTSSTSYKDQTWLLTIE